MGAIKEGRRAAGKRPPPRIPSFEDDLHSEATEAAWRAMTPLLESYGLRRQIHTLSQDELQWLAVAALTGWFTKRAEQYKRTGCEEIGSELLAG